jgi:hypothetical protein
MAQTAPTSAQIAMERLGGPRHLRLIQPAELVTPARTGQGVGTTPAVGAPSTLKKTVATTAAPLAPPRPKAPSRFRRVSRSVVAKVSRPLQAMRHAGVGAALVVMEAVPATLAPVRFCARHLLTILAAALTIGVPALVVAVLWRTVPGWSEGFPLNAILGWGFLAGLYVAVGFFAIVIGVLAKGVVRALSTSTRGLATRGETAFESDPLR